MTETGSKRAEDGEERGKSAIARGKERFRVLFVTRDRVSGPHLRSGVFSRRFLVSSASFRSFSALRGGFAFA